MSFFENTQDLTLLDNNNFSSCMDYFEDILEEPLLESDNYFQNTNSVQDFNNDNIDTNNQPDGNHYNWTYNYSYDQTPNLMGEDIFDNIDYIFNGLNQNNASGSQESLLDRTPSKISNDSIFSNGSSMLTLSSSLTFDQNIKVKSSNTTNKNININSNMEAESPAAVLTTDKNTVNSLSPYSSVVSSPETIQKKINDLYNNINNNLLFNNDSSILIKQECESMDLNIINEKAKENNWTKVDRAKRIRRSTHNNNNNNNNHVSKLQHPKTGKKIADSRLSVAALAEVLKVDSLDEALATERYILDIFENELHYPLGYKTWIRDTPKCERERLINQLYERTKHKYPYYDKSILETIIRRSTYSMMQSRLRKERKRNRKLAQSSSMRSDIANGVDLSINFQQK